MARAGLNPSSASGAAGGFSKYHWDFPALGNASLQCCLLRGGERSLFYTKRCIVRFFSPTVHEVSNIKSFYRREAASQRIRERVCGKGRSAEPVLCIFGRGGGSDCASGLPQKVTGIDGTSQGRAAPSVALPRTPRSQGLNAALTPKGLRPGCRPFSRPAGGSMNTLAPLPPGVLRFRWVAVAALVLSPESSEGRSLLQRCTSARLGGPD